MAKVGWWSVLRGLVSIRADLKGLRAAAERIATALERQAPPVGREGSEEDPLVSVTYVDNEAQEEFMDIELRLTRAKGTPPTEDEIMAEYHRRQEGTEPPPRPERLERPR